MNGVFRLDPSTGRLRQLGTLPVPVHDAAGQMIGNHLVVFGGGSTTSTDLVQSFDLSTGTGSITGRLPVALSISGARPSRARFILSAATTAGHRARRSTRRRTGDGSRRSDISRWDFATPPSLPSETG